LRLTVLQVRIYSVSARNLLILKRNKSNLATMAISTKLITQNFAPLLFLKTVKLQLLKTALYD